jgi:hypothetical protein
MNNVRRDREDNQSYQRRGGRRQEMRDEGERDRQWDNQFRDDRGYRTQEEDYRSRDQYEGSIAREDYPSSWRAGGREREDERRFGRDDRDEGYGPPQYGYGPSQAGSGGYYDSSQSFNRGQDRFGGERYMGQGGDFGNEERYGRDERWGQNERWGREGRSQSEQQRWGQTGWGQERSSFEPRERFGREGQGMIERGYQRIKEFIGKGPKGYSRSDERIKEDVCERLAHGYLDSSNIEVTVTGGEVTLDGTVTSREDRRLAEDILDGVSGVKDIDNKLKVKRAEASTTTGGTSGIDVQSTQRTSGTPPHKRS